MYKTFLTESIRDFARSCREECPLPERLILTEEEELQTQFVGGSFLYWMREQLPLLLRQRSVLPSLCLADEPQIVVVSNIPGLVALEEILEPDNPNFVCLLDTEYEQWQEGIGSLDWEYQVLYWNRFRTPTGSELAEILERIGSRPEGEFRLHEMGEQWYEQCGTESSHLWVWDGEELELEVQDQTVRNCHTHRRGSIT